MNTPLTRELKIKRSDRRNKTNKEMAKASNKHAIEYYAGEKTVIIHKKNPYLHDGKSRNQRRESNNNRNMVRQVITQKDGTKKVVFHHKPSVLRSGYFAAMNAKRIIDARK